MLGLIRTEDLNQPTPPRHHHHVELKLGLSAGEYESLKEASGAIASVRSDAELYRILEWNYTDYFSTLGAHLRAYVEKNGEFFEGHPTYLDINRAMLNFLSSMRTYLDHLETSINRRHGKGSANLRRFKEYCSAAYDGHFSYRFLYRLRNYAQHCSLPINHIRFSIAPPKDPESKPIHSLQVGIQRDQLLGQFDWGPIEQELTSQPALVNISQHVTAMIHLLHDINDRVVTDEVPSLMEKASFIVDLARRGDYDSGELCVFELEGDFGTKNQPKLDLSSMSFTRVPVELSTKILEHGYRAVTLEDAVSVDEG